MFCVGSWRGLEKRAEAFEALGVRVLGLASDTQAQLRGMRDTLGSSFTQLSDPTLQSAEVLGVPVSSKAGYLATLSVHPSLRHLPKKAFTQPSVFVWRGAELVSQWRQTETLTNLFGARGRPSPEQILTLTRQVMAGEAPDLGSP